MQTLTLDGAWHVSQAGQAEVISASVPGCVHLDLLAAGKIEDPFYRDNEDRLQWIGEAEWVYRRTFAVSAELLANEHILLHCDGLDTFATLTVNGRELGHADNMFRTWEFDAKALLQPGENTIEVRFASTLPYIRQRQGERRLPSWSGPHDVAGRAWIRKEPCNFGWDWGPCLVTCGIWRSIRLVAYNLARLSDVQIQQDHSVPGQVSLKVTVAAESTGSRGPLTAHVTVRKDGQDVVAGLARFENHHTQTTLIVQDPALWWPNGLGAQPLYDVTVRLLDGNARELDARQLRIGLRTLRLDRHHDQWGESFQFVVNGVPFFAKGANWIPGDALLPRMGEAEYGRSLRDAAAANMNMLRVWGGGTYESDVFYTLCDELGICIWQDFMFACAIYPAFDAAFMRSVKAEFEDNVRRLRHHACIALWCGNNELEQGLVGDVWTDGQMSWDDYKKLFDALLPEVLQRLDPERDYWPCSPHTPPPGDRKNFNDPTRGDAHLWDVWHGHKPFEWYRTCTHRFNSEFGFQSFPEPKTVRGYTRPADRNVTTFVMEHHQRSGIGNAVIMQYMLDWFRLPTAFDNTLWLSQILQGMAIKYAVEHWRRAMPRGMGTLYWQLNDCWPVASWASLDYHGRWKALHHMARNFYAPLLVSGVEDTAKGTVDIHVTNDLREARHGEVRWHLTNVSGKVLEEGSGAVSAAPGSSALVMTVDVQRALAEHGPRQLLFWIELKVGGTRVSSNLVLFARPKHLELEKPHIGVRVHEVKGLFFLVTLAAKQPALWVWLSLEKTDAQFADNFVHLRPGAPVRLMVTPVTRLTLGQFKKQLRVSSLIDTYA